MAQQQATNPVKLIVVGVGGVGKSALTLHFMYDEFVEDYEPTKADSYRKNITYGQETVHLHILDTAGQEDYAGIRDAFYRSSEGFLLVFDLTDHDSFNSISDFWEQILRVKGTDTPTPILVLGNKLDLTANRRVDHEEAKRWCDERNLKYLETSAKTKENVEAAFLGLAGVLHAQKQQQRMNNVSKPPGERSRKKLRCNIL